MPTCCKTPSRRGNSPGRANWRWRCKASCFSGKPSGARRWLRSSSGWQAAARALLIGAAVGGGAGTGVQAFTKGNQVKIPSETRLDFALEQPFDITYIPSRKSQRQASGQSGSDQPADVPNASSDQPQSN
jgi:hypothetical protein